jgi:signal peptidase I
MTEMKKILSMVLVVLFLSSYVGMIPWKRSVAGSSDDISYVEMKAGSMFPTLQVGDMLIVDSNVTPSQIYAAPWNLSGGSGDILVFRYADELIVHRAVAELNQSGQIYFITQGDDNFMPGPGSPTPAESLTGRVVAYRRTFDAGTWNSMTYNVTVETNSTFYSPYGPGSVQPVNYTSGNFAFDRADKTVKFDITGYLSRANGGFCNVTIPKDLLRCDSLSSWKVYLNGTSTNYLANENSTDTFVYFTYDTPPYTVEITGTTALSGSSTLSLLGLDWWVWLLIAVLVACSLTAAALVFRKKKGK